MMSAERRIVCLAPDRATKILRRIGVAGLVACLLAIVAGPPGALEAQQRPDTLPRSDSLNLILLDSILVQVLRSPISLDDAPYSISVFGEQELFGAKGLVSVEELLEGMPGIQVQNRYNEAVGERISIRGFGGRSQFGVRGVKIFVDDVPATLADGQSTIDHLEFGSLGRVEVLRGPASMLYGGAAGGVIRFETRQPDPSPFREDARLSVGSFGYWRLNSTASGTNGGTGYVIGLGATQNDGFRTNPVIARAPAYGASEKYQLNGRITQDIGPGELAVSFNLTDLSAENPGSLSDSLLAVGDRQAYRFNVIQNTSKEVFQGQIGALWTQPAGPGHVEVAAYGVRRTLDNPIPSAVIDLKRWAGGGRVLFRRAHQTGAGEVAWTTGVELDLQRDDRLNFGNDGGTRSALELDQFERVRTLGGFANLLLITDGGVTITGGARYDQVHFEVEDHFVSGSDLDDSGSRTMDALSPSVGVQVRIADRTNLFGNVSTSFITPTTTELANRPDGSGGFNRELEPVTSVSFEAGIRGQIGQRAAYELVGFHSDIQQELVAFEVANQPGRTFFRNAGESDYNGLEAMVLARPVPAVMTRVTYTYLDATFKQFRVNADDFSGNRIPGTAPHRLDALLRLEGSTLFGDIHSLTVGEIVADDRGRFRTPGYTKFDLRVGLQPGVLVSGGLDLAPFASIENVFDEEYNSSVVVNAFGRRFWEPAPGRTFHVGVAASWAR